MWTTNFRLFCSILFLFTIGTSFVCCQTSDKSASSNNSASIQTQNDWKEFKVENKSGDTVTVFLPEKPESFPGATFTISKDDRLNADVFLAALNEESYVIALIDNLHSDAEAMTNVQKVELFSGCWKAVETFAQRALEEKFKKELEFRSSGQSIVVQDGRQWFYEDYTLGPYKGQARMSFTGKRAFLFVILFPQDKATDKIKLFFEKVKISHSK